MAATGKHDTSGSESAVPALARLTDGNHIAVYKGAGLPDAEWFEIRCDDEKIVLTPIQSVPAEAIAWAREQDAKAATAKTRPYQHLTVDELREVALPERLEELRARGLIQPAWDGPPPAEPFKSVSPPVPPGALERFLKERG